MIIAAKQKDIIKTGEDTSKKATINQDKLAKLQYLLTKGLYSDPESAIIVEWTNNAVDSVVQSGKNPIECPVIVKLTQNKFSVQDKGVGLNKEEFETVCMSYLSSTKENDNSQIGAFGIGLKSFMSLDRSAVFICNKDGIQRKFLSYQGEEFMEYDLIYEKPTEEENGVTCEITINGWSEFSKFRDKAKQKLAYYDTVVLEIDGQIINNQIIRSEDWQYSDYANYSEVHLCLKDVLYKLDYDKLGISRIYVPIALRFDLNSGLTPTPSREALLYTSETIQLIKNKIKKVAEWFVNKYNENTPDERELLEAWDDIPNTSKTVTLANQEFCIDDLIQYSIIKPKELKIHNINIESPNYYHRKGSDIGDEYECIADYDRGKWKTKHIRSVHNLRDKNKKHILVNSTPTGRLKQFLLQKHSGNRVLFIKKINTRKLGGKYVSIGSIDYKNILNLVMRPKNTWRQRIIEWQYVENQFKSLIIDERNCLESKEFLEFVELKKEEAKENRKSVSYVSNSNYVRINKEKGDVTIQVAKSKDKGYGCKFVKEAVRVENLDKLHKSSKALHIYFPEEQKERASQFYKLFHVKYSICILSKNELKRLKEIKPRQFMTEQQFIESRAFCKTMTSLKFDKALDTYKDIYYRTNSEIIENVLYKFKNQKEELQKYVNANGRSIDDDLLGELKEIAELKGLYDHSLDDVYNEFVNNIKKYEFISCLSKPRSWDSEEVAKYNKLINSLLLLKSKYNNYEDLEIEVKEKPISVLPVVEELVLEESN